MKLKFILILFSLLFFSCAHKDNKTIKYKNGDLYSGQILRTKDKETKEGKGQYIWFEDKMIYTGQWKNDFMEGKGKLFLKNGDFFEGEFINNKKHGKGRYTFKNGDVFQGIWKDDLRNGRGKIRYFNGKIEEGIWKDDKKIHTDVTELKK